MGESNSDWNAPHGIRQVGIRSSEAGPVEGCADSVQPARLHGGGGSSFFVCQWLLTRHIGPRLTRALSTFSPIPKRVMNGSEPGEVLPAAVLSGAPIELEARQVRYFPSSKYVPKYLSTDTSQHLPPSKDSNTIRHLAQSPLAHGLGHPEQRSQMGESADGLEILGGFYAGHTHQLQEQGRRNRVC